MTVSYDRMGRVTLILGVYCSQCDLTPSLVAPFELLKITAESNTLFESALAPGPGGLA